MNYKLKYNEDKSIDLILVLDKCKKKDFVFEETFSLVDKEGNYLKNINIDGGDRSWKQELELIFMDYIDLDSKSKKEIECEMYRIIGDANKEQKLVVKSPVELEAESIVGNLVQNGVQAFEKLIFEAFENKSEKISELLQDALLNEFQKRVVCEKETLVAFTTYYGMYDWSKSSLVIEGLESFEKKKRSATKQIKKIIKELGFLE